MNDIKPYCTVCKKFQAEVERLQAEVERLKGQCNAITTAGHNANVKLVEENYRLRAKVAELRKLWEGLHTATSELVDMVEQVDMEGEDGEPYFEPELSNAQAKVAELRAENEELNHLLLYRHL